MPQWNWEFVDDNAVTIWEDGQRVTTGHGSGRDAALLDAWTTLTDTNRDDLAAWVGQKYRVLTGREPRRPRS